MKEKITQHQQKIDQTNTIDDEAESIVLSAKQCDVRLISYNITADYFDKKDETSDSHHHWKIRRPFVIRLLGLVYPDIICLQELSPDQPLEVHQYFGEKQGYRSVFLSQTPSETPAGEIAYNEEVSRWRGKKTGTPLIGTFISRNYKFLEVNRFWLNEYPDQIPDNTDRGETDKGFGNINTYRTVLWAKVQISDDKQIFIFNSHYPLSGSNKTRLECVKLEMSKIKDITQGANWISAGDRNFIPSKDDNDLCNPIVVRNELIKHGRDKENSSKHYGISTTWIVFSYDEHKNQIKGDDFTDPSVLDVIVSSMKQNCTFFLHGAFDPIIQELLPSLENLNEQQNDSRYFASDHALVGADFIWD